MDKIQNQHSKLNFDPFQTEVIIKVFYVLKQILGLPKFHFSGACLDILPSSSVKKRLMDES